MADSLTEKECPYTGPYALPDNPSGHPAKGPTCEALKRGLSRAGAPSLPWADFDQHFNKNLEEALDWMDKKSGLAGMGGYAEGRWGRVRKLKADAPHEGEWALDEYALRLIRGEATEANESVPKLGPLFIPGKNVIDQDLTHATSGIYLYPAFDDAFGQGVAILAPENLEVTKASSSNPGDAFYATGESGLRYWFGHLSVAPGVGKNFNKGAGVGVTCANNVGGGPHCHLGVNVENLWGSGMQLHHSTNYTHNGYTIGEQLKDGPQ